MGTGCPSTFTRKSPRERSATFRPIESVTTTSRSMTRTSTVSRNPGPRGSDWAARNAARAASRTTRATFFIVSPSFRKQRGKAGNDSGFNPPLALLHIDGAKAQELEDHPDLGGDLLGPERVHRLVADGPHGVSGQSGPCGANERRRRARVGAVVGEHRLEVEGQS